jgi:hypothetical protein
LTCGNRRVRDNQLAASTQLQPRRAYSEALLQSDLEAIRAAYTRVGRGDVHVSHEIVDLGGNRVNVVYNIQEGGRTKIASVSFEGNTAPYLQYAYTRVQSIFRKAGVDPEQLLGPITLESEQERALALKLLQIAEALEQVSREALPHLLCTYLYELASLYMSFYEACPVLHSEVPEALRTSRLLLCHLVARTLAHGLDLLGIDVMEQM